MTPPPSFIGDFSDEDIAWVIANGIQQPFAAGQRLVAEGEELDTLYVILEGTFVVSGVVLGAGFTAWLGPGEIVGETAFVRGGAPLGTVRAETEGTVLEIPRSRLDEKIRADQGFAARFHKVVSEFTVERFRLLRERHAAPEEPPPPGRAEIQDAESLRVHELIERMLRGDFP